MQNRERASIAPKTLLRSAERLAALAMIERHADRPCAVTLGADKGYDAAEFVNQLRAMNLRPHVAQNDKRRGGSAIDRRTTRY